MARLTALDPTSAAGDARELLGTVQAAFGMVPNFARTLANAPSALAGWLTFHSALSNGVLPPKIREQIALVVAQENLCDYCVSAHSYIGKHVAGLSDGEIEASRDAHAPDPKADAALKLAQAIIRTRGAVTDEELSRARRGGLSDAEITETVAHTAINVFTNYFNRLAEPQIDFPTVLSAARPRP